MTTWSNVVVKSGSAAQFYGDMFMLSSWYNHRSVDYDGFNALNNLNFIVDSNKLRVVIVPNGAGKTTLLDVICVRPNRPTVASFSARRQI